MNLIKSVKDYISEVLTITDYGSDSKNIINKYKSNFLE